MERFKRKEYLCFIFLILIVSLMACTSSPDFEAYEGDSLKIAVVGNPPKVKEEQVRFTKISFDEMVSEEMNSYDAVFIREDYLLEASKNQYADVYLASSHPFFFIGTNNFLPFTQEDYKYDKTSNWTSGTSYTVGILASQENDTLNAWGYSLSNDTKTDEYMKEMYSRVFKTIDELNR